MTDALPATPIANAAASPSPEPTPGTRIFTGQLFRVRDGKGWTFVDEPPAPPEPVRRPARVARMLALAHRLQAMIDAGDAPDRATLARRLGFSRARITQLLDLLLLAPTSRRRSSSPRSRPAATPSPSTTCARWFGRRCGASRGSGGRRSGPRSSAPRPSRRRGSLSSGPTESSRGKSIQVEV